MKNLEKHAKNTKYKYNRLYRNLYNREFYLLAYKNITLSTKITTSINYDIDNVISMIKNHSYQPTTSIYDKLIQEIVRMILESIYDPTFSKKSHGFKSNHSPHTALLDVQNTFKEADWIIECDITSCFCSFDHHLLINILRQRIHDEYFISLIWKFLKAGYMEQWNFNKTYSGTPQGLCISSTLANIYLSELDTFIEKYNSVQYCRYAGTFLVGIVGSKADAQQIKCDIRQFFQQKLLLATSEKDIKVKHSSDRIHFLGYELTVLQSKSVEKCTQKVKLYLPRDKWIEALRKYKAFKINKNNNGKESWKAVHRGFLINKTDIEIICRYNREIRGIYNYYRLASNVSVLRMFRHIMESSMMKTFAAKYNSSINKIKVQYIKNGFFCVNHTTKSGIKRYEFYNQSFIKSYKPAHKFIDILPEYRPYRNYFK